MGRLLDNDGQEKSGVPNGLSPKQSFMPGCGSGERMAWALSTILSAGLPSAPLLSALTTPVLVSSFLRPRGS